jgi:hypothetical protein
VSGAFSQRSRHHKKLISRLAAWAGSRIGDRYIRALLFVMLGNCNHSDPALGYGVREWAFRQSDCGDKGDVGPSEKGTGLVGMANRRPGLNSIGCVQWIRIPLGLATADCYRRRRYSRPLSV